MGVRELIISGSLEVFVFDTNLAFLYNIDIEGFLKSFSKK